MSSIIAPSYHTITHALIKMLVNSSEQTSGEQSLYLCASSISNNKSRKANILSCILQFIPDLRKEVDLTKKKV